MKKVIISIVCIISLIATGCNFKFSDGSGRSILDGPEQIVFSDFLVERCVRKTLNKGWDEVITTDDAAGIKELLIDNIYDPGIGTNFYVGVSGFDWYQGYIDLEDLKYFTNLEVIKIDNIIGADMVTNIDSMKNCKKLKKIYMQYQPGTYNIYSGISNGYKYWTDIIAELPELEYVDLGMYVDEHMKEIMLSKSQNKNVTFYNGKYDGYKKQILGTVFGMFANPVTQVSLSEYEGYMKYTYDGADVGDEDKSGLSSIPMLDIKSSSELDNAIATLSDSVEDLFIRLWPECDSFDCTKLSKFKNLTTLTLIKSKTTVSYPGRYPYMQINNIESLNDLPYLQVINLGACKADVTSLGNKDNLREIAFNVCDISGIQGLKKAEKLSELKIMMTTCNDIGSQTYSENTFKSLKYFSCLGNNSDIEGHDYLSMLKDMGQLKTFSIDGDVNDISILNNCKMLENINISGVNTSQEYDIAKISSLSNLKTLSIKQGSIKNADKIMNFSNINAVVFQTAIKGMSSNETKTLLDNASKSDKITMFSIIDGTSSNYTAESLSKISKDSAKALYDKGIHDGLVQIRIMQDCSAYGKASFDDAWSEINKWYGKY